MTNNVKNQYELYPYPERHPEDEKKRLYSLAIDHLALINHYCFGGRETFQNNFRVLVAGGGTGDSLIFLAEQLRKTNAEIVYLDFSEASMSVAKARADIRKLTNIQWIQGDLSEIKKLALGKFDFINCLGVLHHLENPLQALSQLASCLNERGAMSIMVYAKYGRTGVYQVQEMMKMLKGKTDDPEVKIRNTIKMLGALPDSNWFKRSEALFSDHKKGKAGLYDLFLHSVDKPFSVPEIFEWVEKAGVQFIDFCPNRTLYWPETLIEDETLLESIQAKPRKVQMAIAELMRGDLTKHEFYVSKRPGAKADLSKTDLIPFFLQEPEKIKNLFDRNPGNTLEISLNSGGKYALTLTDEIRRVIAEIDGIKSLKDLNIPPNFSTVYEALNAFNYLFLRSADAPS